MCFLSFLLFCFSFPPVLYRFSSSPSFYRSSVFIHYSRHDSFVFWFIFIILLFANFAGNFPCCSVLLFTSLFCSIHSCTPILLCAFSLFHSLFVFFTMSSFLFLLILAFLSGLSVLFCFCLSAFGAPPFRVSFL